MSAADIFADACARVLYGQLIVPSQCCIIGADPAPVSTREHPSCKPFSGLAQL
jgi:hypothetical protein